MGIMTLYNGREPAPIASFLMSRISTSGYQYSSLNPSMNPIYVTQLLGELGSDLVKALGN